MKLMESGENYMETILILEKRFGFVRSVDIATELGVSKPSVSHAMMQLRNAGYITMEERTSQIRLTEEGRSIAERVYDRHVTLSRFLMSIGVGEANATADACKIEHDISEETFQAIKQFLER